MVKTIVIAIQAEQSGETVSQAGMDVYFGFATLYFPSFRLYISHERKQLF